MAPKRYRGAPLQFSAQIESGNMDYATRCGEYQYDIHIRRDEGPSGASLWFNFQVTSMEPGRAYLFHLFGINKPCTTHSSGQRVLVKSRSQPRWQRLPFEQQFYHQRGDGAAVLSFVFACGVSEWHQFSFGYPYTYTQLQRLARGLRESGALAVSSLGRSFLGRDIPLFQSLAGGPGAPSVVVTARCHPGETPASYVVHGLLARLLSGGDAAWLRGRVNFHVAPMLNPDGVVLGTYRCTASGADMNRHYGAAPSPQLPEVAAVERFLRSLAPAASGGFLDIATNCVLAGAVPQSPPAPKLDFVLDLHSHSALAGGLLLYNSVQPDSTSADPRRNQAAVNFLRALNRNCATFTYYQDKNVPGCLRRSIFAHYYSVSHEAAPHVFGIEVSNSHGPSPHARGSGGLTNYDEVEFCSGEEPEVQHLSVADRTALSDHVPYTPDEYMAMGARLFDTLRDIYAAAFGDTGALFFQ